VIQIEATPVRAITVSTQFTDRQAELDYALNCLKGTAPTQTQLPRGQRIDECVSVIRAMLDDVEVSYDPSDQKAIVVSQILPSVNDLYIETRVTGEGRNLEEVYRQCTRILARQVDTHVAFQKVSTHHTR